jgi:hypothetical protein
MCVTLPGLPGPQGQHMETVDLAHEHERAYARWVLRTERLERSGRSIPAQGATRICPSLADEPVMARAVFGRRNEPKAIAQGWRDDLPGP